ncbi:MAG: response regulator transcription factor [Actinomycetota bacterium]
MGTRVVLVEDDQRVASAVIDALSALDYDVEHHATGLDALRATDGDLMLLDLGLPDMDGLDVCRAVAARSTMPIIAVTARGAVDQRVDGLRAGADDYVVKPFSIAELEARIEAVLRRSGRLDEHTAGAEPAAVTVGDVAIDHDGHQVTVDGETISLTPKEFDLLAVLASRPGHVFTRGELLLQVWHSTWEGRSRTVDVHVGSLRNKTGRSELIRTVHGVGYALDSGGDDEEPIA